MNFLSSEGSASRLGYGTLDRVFLLKCRLVNSSCMEGDKQPWGFFQTNTKICKKIVTNKWRDDIR